MSRLRASRALRDPAVTEAFLRVPRHLFLPGVPLQEAYQDEAIPTKVVDGEAVSSSSQPAIMAIMLEQLVPAPGQRVLEIGAGTGYNAALLAELVGPAGSVVTLDIDADLVEGAAAHLAAAGACGVEVVLADGAGGWPPGAPYDRIILTVGASDLAPAWFDQLSPGGRLVLPLSIRGVQQSVCFEHRGDHLASLSLRSCGFMPLRGAMRDPGQRVPLPGHEGVTLWVPDARPVDAAAASEALRRYAGDRATGLRLAGAALGGLARWLALRDPRAAQISVTGPPEWVSSVPLPALAEQPFHGGVVRSAPALLGRSALAAIGALAPPPVPRRAAPLAVRSWGDPVEADDLSAALVAHALAWDRSGRSPGGGIRIRAYLGPAEPPAAKGEVVVETGQARLVVSGA